MKKLTLKQTIRLREGCITITIPKGFKTDGVSIPRIFWWFGKPFDSDTLISAIVHDNLYHTHVPKLISDLIFLHLMKRYEVKWYKRWIYFIVVLMFGRKTTDMASR